MKQNKNITKKLKFIESLVYFHGIINREDIIKKFNVSAASATNILSKYNQIAPKNMNYNIRLKRYEISNSFKPIFNNIRMLFERIPVYTLPSLYGSITNNEIKNIAIISRAIQKTQSLEINYVSLSNSKVSKRQIVPVAFANTHLRWHLRAYDRKRNRYADFVFRRILKVKPIKKDIIQEHEHPNNDKQWHLFIDLKIKKHPHNVKNSNIINPNTHNIKIRSAMVRYFLQLWNVDCSANARLRGLQYQYALENIKKVSQSADLKLAPGYEKQKQILRRK